MEFYYSFLKALTESSDSRAELAGLNGSGQYNVLRAPTEKSTSQSYDSGQQESQPLSWNERKEEILLRALSHYPASYKQNQ